ncbi:MAG: alpha-N-acetylglucosaminidase [Ignavibacteriae bacterium]|nr:alpha-N-acetylglucosaminidase [Ignavibacteriota bacterium]
MLTYSTANKVNIESTKFNILKDLFKSILPNAYQKFEVELDSKINGFSINSVDEEIILTGSNLIEIAAAFNWYLKYYLKYHIGWNHNEINLTENLRKLNFTLTYKSQFQYRYYLNYCTFSYSMPWWNWERWSKEINLMALNGVNLVLSMVGQEAVWQKFMLDVGSIESEVFEFLPGPAYTAWAWLNNIEGWGGPTTQNRIDNQKELQDKIINKFKQYEITPILQLFSGRVPKSFKRLFPDANIMQLPSWYGYEGIYFLDPSDPLFTELAFKFYDIQNSFYGNYHFFAGDIFHEINSSEFENTRLSNLFKNIQDNLLKYDKDAKWVMQSWTIREDSINLLDKSKLLILDMFGEHEPKWESTNEFHETPWVCGIINNFGGRTGLSGNQKKIFDNFYKAKLSLTKNLFSGIGIMPEGIENNQFLFELFWEMNWRNEEVNPKEWIKDFAERRYQIKHPEIEKAWLMLLDSVYSGPEGYAPIETVLCAVPSFNIIKAGSNGSTKLYYDNAVLKNIILMLLSVSEENDTNQYFSFDLLDISRQYLVNKLNELYESIIKSYNEKNIIEFKNYTSCFIQICIDLDELLLTNKHFTLGNWLETAKENALDDNDKKIFEWNARTQITLWSSPEIPEFHDYANKQWAGLIKDYYLPRWKKFFEICLSNLETNQKFDESYFNAYIKNHAVDWANKTDKHIIESKNNSIELINKIINKKY